MKRNDLTPAMPQDTQKFLENNVSFWALPSRRKAFYEIDIKRKAAVTIQAAWRGYQVRQMYKAAYKAYKKEAAAIIIQTAVRRWLYGKKIHNLMTEQITKEEHKKINEKIKRWRENHEDVSLIDKTELEEAHKDVQNKLAIWYAQASSRELRRKRVESLCAQLEATSIILQGTRDLEDLKPDSSFYQCSSLPLAIEARLNHKQQIKALTARWWELLSMPEQMT